MNIRTARALYPHRPEMWEPEYLYEPLPEPQDHPEFDLWGFERVRNETEAASVGALAKVRISDSPPSALCPQPAEQEPLAARMLNEFVYCPRLFYYEQVEGVFVENADTARGSAIHEKVDRGKGTLPKVRKLRSDADTPVSSPATDGDGQNPPDNHAPASAATEADHALASAATEADHALASAATEADHALASAATEADHALASAATKTEAATETIHSRSAMLSSTRLGVVAKMDLIEVKMQVIEDEQVERAVPSQPSDAPLTRSLATVPTVPPAKRSAKKSREAADQPDLFSSRVRPDVEGQGVVAEGPSPNKPPSGEGGYDKGGNAAIIPRIDLRQRVVHSVTPVDYKVGAPRLGKDVNELWDADMMQLGLQILILRDNGYTCDEGVIYYRATKQRVKLVMTAEIEAWIIQQIAAARAAMVAPTIPPPLVNSPKCVRCSLAPVCLPDETRMLSAISSRVCKNVESPAHSDSQQVRSLVTAPTLLPPRRLIAARDDERALYLNTQGYRVGVKSERLIIKDGDSVIDEVRLIDVTHVALFGNIQLSTQALQELCDQEIPIAYFSMGGWFYGLTRGHGLKNVHTRIRQFATAANPLQCLTLAQKIVQAKIRNHRTMLMRLHVEPPSKAVIGMKEIAARVPSSRGLDELLGMEGAAAALYFQSFAGMIKVGEDDLDDDIPGLEPDAQAKTKQEAAVKAFTFDFTQRRRRPPTDPVNALLSLAYSLLAKDCTIAALAVGFDPYVGFYHQPRHGRPALALDLMEEFRPLIAESAVLTAINNRMIHAGHFVQAGDAVNLTPQGRKAFFFAYEQRMNSLITHPVFDYKVSYRRVIALQARLLARHLTGEIPDYIPMVTR
jgi:CRISPR-associated protein Cas1